MRQVLEVWETWNHVETALIRGICVKGLFS